VGVLVAVAILITVGVYGLVAAIVKLDDLGLWLAGRETGWARGLGRGIVGAAPWLMHRLAIAGTAAMFLVGGGIVVHQVPAVHQAVEWLMDGQRHTAPEAVPAALTLLFTRTAEAAFGVGLGLVMVGVLVPGRRVGRWLRRELA